MGKNTDKLYVTHSEHTGVYGGHHTASSSGYVQYVYRKCVDDGALTVFSTASRMVDPHRPASLLTVVLSRSNRSNIPYAREIVMVRGLFLIWSISFLGSSACPELVIRHPQRNAHTAFAM